MTTTYLDLDATQAATLARGERVERWVPLSHDTIDLDGWPAERVVVDPAEIPADFAYNPHGIQPDNGYFHLPCRPHPNDPQDIDHWIRNRFWPKVAPGTRARVREPWATIMTSDVFGYRTVSMVVRGEYSRELRHPHRNWVARLGQACGVRMWQHQPPHPFFEIGTLLPAKYLPDAMIRLEAVCKSVTPEVSDGWGFVEGWEVVRG